jgi:hypothetical protein
MTSERRPAKCAENEAASARPEPELPTRSAGGESRWPNSRTAMCNPESCQRPNEAEPITRNTSRVSPSWQAARSEAGYVDADWKAKCSNLLRTGGPYVDSRFVVGSCAFRRVDAIRRPPRQARPEGRPVMSGRAP